MKVLPQAILLFSIILNFGTSIANDGSLKAQHHQDPGLGVHRNLKENLYFHLDSKKRVIASLELLLGFGSAEMDYDITSPAPGNTNSPVIGRNFSTSYTNVQLQAALSYSFKNLAVGGMLALAKTNATDGSQTFRRETGSDLFTRSLQNWPNGRTYYGFFTEYEIQIAEKLVVAPSFQYLWYSFTGKGSFVTNDQFADASFSYNDSFINRQSQGYGAVFKLALNQKFSLGVKAMYQVDQFDINEGFLFEEIANFKMNMSSFYMGANLSFILLK